MATGANQSTKNEGWSFGDVVFIIAFWGGIFLYYNFATDVHDRLFVEPAISQAESLEAQGRLPEALDLLTAQAGDNAQNPNLLWALGDYYTKADSPLLARFYFKALTHVDAKDLPPERIDFAKPWQGADTDVDRAIQREVDEAHETYRHGTKDMVHPESANAMLNQPAGNIDITAGYFDPDHPVRCDGAASCCPNCGYPFRYSSGNLWQSIAAQHLIISESYGGKDCCSLSLDDPDLRSPDKVEGEFRAKLQGSNVDPDSDAGAAALLAFRARLLAKQRYVLGFLGGASSDPPPTPDDFWHGAWFWAKIIGWIIVLAILRTFIGERIAKWKKGARAAPKPAVPSAAPKPQPAVAPHTARATTAAFAGRTTPLWRRIAFFILAALLLLAGAGYIADSARTFYMPGAVSYVPGAGTITGSGNVSESQTNGINFAAGLSLVLAGLLALNRGTRRNSEMPGFVDSLVGRLGRLPWQLIAGGGALAAFVTFGSLFFDHTVMHFDRDEAVTAFKTDVGGLDIFVDGDWIYGISPDGETTHLAAFSPALYRALDRANVEIGALRVVQFPVPGFLPLFILAGLCAANVWRWRRGGSGANPGRWTARAFLAFGLLQLYVVLWLVSAQAGIDLRSGLNPDWLGPFLFVLVSQLVVLAALYDRLKKGVLAAPQLWGWIGLYCATSLATLPWAYHFSDASPRGPALLWISLHLGLGALLWLLMMMGRREKRAPA